MYVHLCFEPKLCFIFKMIMDPCKVSNYLIKAQIGPSAAQACLPVFWTLSSDHIIQDIFLVNYIYFKGIRYSELENPEHFGGFLVHLTSCLSKK